MNKFIGKIEWEGYRYGLKLNKDKCELLTTNNTANIHFQDNMKIKIVKAATYLGCNIGIKTSGREELGKRFANTVATMKKLDIFWRHSNISTAIKVYTADAILRSKLLYGIESAQLIKSVSKKLETLQLKVLRKILKLDTTYINRVNTNDTIFESVNQKIKAEGKKKKKHIFSRRIQQFWKKQNM